MGNAQATPLILYGSTQQLSSYPDHPSCADAPTAVQVRGPYPRPTVAHHPCICTHARALLGLMTASFRCTWVSLSRRIARCASHASHHHSCFLAAHSNLSSLGDSLIAKLLGMAGGELRRRRRRSAAQFPVQYARKANAHSTAQHTKATTTRQRTREWLAINFDAVYPEVCNRQPSSLPSSPSTHVAAPLICGARAFLPASLPFTRDNQPRASNIHKRAPPTS